MPNLLSMQSLWDKALIFLFLEFCMTIISFGQLLGGTQSLTGVRFADSRHDSYSGKIEIQYKSCGAAGLVCESDWYAVCHDGQPSWNRAAASTACKQLGFEAGWNTFENGVTALESIEDVSCTGESTSLSSCTSDHWELCGCSGITYSILNNDKCDDHVTKKQAAVECFDFDDVNVVLQPQDDGQDSSQGAKKLQIEYRRQLYDVCFNGWSIQEAHVVCRQIGFQRGAVLTSPSFLSNEYRSQSSFADFSCDGDEDNLFLCLSNPPRNGHCDDGRVVLLRCVGMEVPTEASRITSTATPTTSPRKNTPETSSIASTAPQTEKTPGPDTQSTQNNNGMMTETNTQFPTTRVSVSSSNVGLFAGVISAVVFLVIVVIVVVFVLIIIQKRRGTNDAPSKVEKGTVHDNQAFSDDADDVDPYEDVDFADFENDLSSKLDIAFENMRFTGEVLGKGNFGEVQLAKVKVKNKRMSVAVKTLKEGAPETDRVLFKQEFDTMTKIGYHPNIVNILGSCEHEGSFYVILENVQHGNLRKCLRNCRKEEKKGESDGKTSIALTPHQLLNIALGVGKAMKHIADCGIIHRDIAARNVLIGSGYMPKLADFGLSREHGEEDIYVQTSSSRVPARWLAIESMTKKVYSTKSDVWSFGILLWEIATFGGTPYADMETKDLAHQLTNGYRMPKPDNCADDMYQLMLQCWHANPDSRPSFKYIVDILIDMASQDKVYMGSPYANSSVLQFRSPAARPKMDDEGFGSPAVRPETDDEGLTTGTITHQYFKYPADCSEKDDK